MTFEWEAYYRLAKGLYEIVDVDQDSTSDIHIDNQALCRASISRAYYAVFNEAKLFLQSKNVWLPHTGAAHDKIISHLRDSLDDDWNEVGDLLSRLKIKRTKSDYNEVFPKLYEETKLAVGLAKQALDNLNEIKSH